MTQYPHLIILKVSKLLKKAIIRFSTHFSTDINIIINVLVCVQRLSVPALCAGCEMKRKIIQFCVPRTFFSFCHVIERGLKYHLLILGLYQSLKLCY